MTHTEPLTTGSYLSAATAVENLLTWFDASEVDVDGLLGDLVDRVNEALPDGVTWDPAKSALVTDDEFDGRLSEDEAEDAFEEVVSECIDEVRSDIESRTTLNGYRWAA